MASQPGQFLNWLGSSPTPPSAYQAQPPAGQLQTGFLAGQPPPYRFVNYALWLLDQWVQYLASIATQGAGFTTVTGSGVISTGFQIYLGDTTSGAFTLTLPQASLSSGYQVTVKNKWATGNNLTLTPNGTDNIEGANASIVLAQGDFFTLICDGTQWWITNEG